ncbi:hypothetical protein H2198_007152 [Neophaeococcomyces mojaviensis]|uniref:Uncharacterized protein n=1 Tax=Neophaeococcomyces mojaviensis TaxID=3383035 RepID=A0ACC3A0Z3_9EURO|nr:hypothetical protein H2198_007152 [Knufia sp. JES_112]
MHTLTRVSNSALQYQENSLCASRSNLAGTSLSDDQESDNSDSVYNEAEIGLREMGVMAILANFILQRRDAIAMMQEMLPVQNLNEYVVALDMFAYAAEMQTLKKFGDISRNCRSLKSGRDWELITRRLLDTGQLYLNNTPSREVARLREDSFGKELSLVKHDLARYYRSRGDDIEASRLFATSFDDQRFLADHTIHDLGKIATQMTHFLRSIYNGVRERYCSILHPSSDVSITAGQLAVIIGRNVECIHPEECGVDTAAEITGRTIFHLAVEAGDLAYLKAVLQTEDEATTIALQERDEMRMTPLMVAAYTGNIEIFKLLVEKGADKNAQAVDGKSVLSLASIAGNDDIVQYLLEVGVNANVHMNCSPVHDAILAKQFLVAETLLTGGADPRARYGEHRRPSASDMAAQCGQTRLAETLRAVEKRLTQRELRSQPDLNAPEDRKRKTDHFHPSPRQSTDILQRFNIEHIEGHKRPRNAVGPTTDPFDLPEMLPQVGGSRDMSLDAADTGPTDDSRSEYNGFQGITGDPNSYDAFINYEAGSTPGQQAVHFQHDNHVNNNNNNNNNQPTLGYRPESNWGQYL